jgi:hypothetical protein
MAASNYVVGALLMDRFGYSPRVVTAGVGIFFLLPGIMWFVTEKVLGSKRNYSGAEQRPCEVLRKKMWRPTGTNLRFMFQASA